MRKNYIYAIFVFLLAFTSFGQKVTLTPTTVNGQSVSGGPINLGGTPNSTISLGVNVEMPAIPGNYGTITIHSVNGLNDNIVTGGNGGTLFFGEGKSASRSFVINLLWSSFTTSGSYIYAEYKTGGGVIYKSSNLAIIKNATQGGGTPQIPADAPDPAKIPNSICCNQTVRLGDKPTIITGSQYLNPYQGQTYGINASWQVNGNPNVRILEVDNANKTLSLDYIENTGNFTVMRGLGYPTTLTPTNKSNTITITVIPSPITSNNILVYAEPNPDGFIEHININPIEVSGGLNKVNVNLDILDNPFHTYSRLDRFTDVERFEWEYTKTSKGLGGIPKWITIPNENSSILNYFNPAEISNTEDNYYLLRRIAIYKGIKSSSNVLKIMVRTIGYNNTICCDQVVKILSSTNFETPDTIIGSTPILDNTDITGKNFLINDISYQWQVQSIGSQNTSTWSNILGATSKNYLPAQKFTIKSSGRTGTVFIFDESYKYRRISKINYLNMDKSTYGNVSSYSNEVSLYGSTYEEETKIYPNPTSSLLNIESRNISLYQINIVNIKGETINTQLTIINPNLISLDVSNLITGTYFITMQRVPSGIIQKTFIKN
ncbi:T9SS type A sorting domain-containing protein [Flavobacterium soyae]|uniref:T9SS type A sorting domain-containing protein n=1 Tax=Flavobacterium soyae TaxID=2903098 RepID=UPI001E4CBC7D|nr:T9SS type A sorting domain-containing protein [Flavobacterium soyae]MCD9575714.1 T9SS type A sorting domain-containing protein [Flavobacterium soyae]